MAELLFFIEDTVSEMGVERATGFLKKFYGWYLGRGRFPKPFKQELVQLPTIAEVQERLLAAAPGAPSELLAALRADVPDGRAHDARSAGLDLRGRLGVGALARRLRGTRGGTGRRYASPMAAVATGQKRIVSVLIADVVNSTGIGEKLGPERSKFLMDEVLRVMATQIRRYDGTVVQRVGDEIFALFGAPVAHEDDSERAVLAALAIQRAIARYARR